jgi:hypothetical protein
VSNQRIGWTVAVLGTVGVLAGALAFAARQIGWKVPVDALAVVLIAGSGLLGGIMTILLVPDDVEEISPRGFDVEAPTKASASKAVSPDSDRDEIGRTT